MAASRICASTSWGSGSVSMRRMARVVGAVNHVCKGEASAVELRRAVQAALRDFEMEVGEAGVQAATAGASSAPSQRPE